MHRVRNVVTAACWCICVAMLTGGPAAAQVPGGGLHPLMPGQQLVLQCRWGDADAPRAIEAPLELASYSQPAELAQTVALPGLDGHLRVRRFLPRATLCQQAVPTDGEAGRPLVELHITGPTQEFTRWLAAGDEEHNRLLSFIATWRFMTCNSGKARDELFKAFADELSRPPMLLVGRPEGEPLERFEARPGVEKTVSALNCTLRVKEFFPHFAFDQKQGHPINRSQRRLNPAALIEIVSGDQHEERWVFARFPKFNAGKTSLPVRVQLDCPVVPQRPTPDFAIVAVDGRRLELWTRTEKECTSRAAALGQAVAVPGSKYSFTLTRFVPAGRLVERYEQTDQRNAVRVIEVEVAASDGTASVVWLPMGKTRAVDLGGQRLLLWFGPRARPVEKASDGSAARRNDR